MAVSTALAKPVGRPSRERAARIDGAIVEATIQAFTESGTDFSMDEVAATAGISKQAIYRRWPGKIDLIIHAVVCEMKRNEEAIGKALPRDPGEALREVAWRTFNGDHTRHSRFDIFVQAEGLRNQRLRERLSAIHEVRLDWLEQYIAPVFRDDGSDGGPTLREMADILLELIHSGHAALEWRSKSTTTLRRAVFGRRWRAFERLLGRA